MATPYSILRYWSIAHCCKVARVSLADEHGQEYFATVPMLHLRSTSYRERLDAVLDQVQDAIERRDAPGEVRVVLRAA